MQLLLPETAAHHSGALLVNAYCPEWTRRQQALSSPRFTRDGSGNSVVDRQRHRGMYDLLGWANNNVPLMKYNPRLG